MLYYPHIWGQYKCLIILSRWFMSTFRAPTVGGPLVNLEWAAARGMDLPATYSRARARLGRARRGLARPGRAGTYSL